MEKEILPRYGIPFKGIMTGKLRRYFSLQNVIDIFKVWIGIIQAFFLIGQFKPDVVFSKGGYVSVPVVVAAGFLGKRIIIHDSDAIPGLATKIGARFADQILVNFVEAKEDLPKDKEVIRVGIPLRADLLKGEAEKGRQLTGFTGDLPTVLVMGGSLGAGAINRMLVEALPTVLPHCQVIHVCGKGKQDEPTNLEEKLKTRYRSFPFLNKELKDVYAMTDLVVGRAGANALAEIKALMKPNIVIPLPKKGSRGDQIANAEIWGPQGYGVVLMEEDLTAAVLGKEILGLLEDTDRQNQMRKNLEKESDREAAQKIRDLILKT